MEMRFPKGKNRKKEKVPKGRMGSRQKKGTSEWGVRREFKEE